MGTKRSTLDLTVKHFYGCCVDWYVKVNLIMRIFITNLKCSTNNILIISIDKCCGMSIAFSFFCPLFLIPFTFLFVSVCLSDSVTVTLSVSHIFLHTLTFSHLFITLSDPLSLCLSLTLSVHFSPSLYPFLPDFLSLPHAPSFSNHLSHLILFFHLSHSLFWFSFPLIFCQVSSLLGDVDSALKKARVSVKDTSETSNVILQKVVTATQVWM